jgi:hypothetical protein
MIDYRGFEKIKYKLLIFLSFLNARKFTGLYSEESYRPFQISMAFFMNYERKKH